MGVGTTRRMDFGAKEFVGLLLVAAYLMNFMNFGVYLPVLLLPVAFACLLHNRLSRSLVILASFCIVYSFVTYLYGYASKGVTFMYLVYPVCAYAVGASMVKRDVDYKKTYRLLLVIVGAFTLYGFLSLRKTLIMFGGIDGTLTAFGGRMVISLWGDNPMTATGLNTYLSLGLSMMAVVLLPRNSAPKFARLFLFLCFLLCAYSTLVIGNRTGMFVLAASLIAVFFFVGKLRLKKVVTLFLALLLAVIINWLYKVDFLGSKSALQETLLYERFNDAGVTEDPRYEAWEAAFRGLFYHPMGGKETALPLKYAHNLWLDVGYSTGIFPFLLLVIFTVMTLVSFRKFTTSDAPVLLKGMMVALFTAFLITSFVEPIMEGWFTFFNVFCLVVGVVNAKTNESRVVVPKLLVQTNRRLLYTGLSLLVGGFALVLAYATIN